MHDMGYHNANEINTDDNDVGVSDNEGYSMKT